MTYDEWFDDIRARQIENAKRPDTDPVKSVAGEFLRIEHDVALLLRDGLMEPKEALALLRGYQPKPPKKW
jgi:hypothetical protein